MRHHPLWIVLAFVFAVAVVGGLCAWIQARRPGNTIALEVEPWQIAGGAPTPALQSVEISYRPTVAIPLLTQSFSFGGILRPSSWSARDLTFIQSACGGKGLSLCNIRRTLPLYRIQSMKIVLKEYREFPGNVIFADCGTTAACGTAQTAGEIDIDFDSGQPKPAHNRQEADEQSNELLFQQEVMDAARTNDLQKILVRLRGPAKECNPLSPYCKINSRVEFQYMKIHG